MDALLKVLSAKSPFWWINETGIALEILGGALLAAAAFRSRRQIKDIQNTWDAELAVKLRETIAGQAFTELKGFLLLTAGPICQMIVGFGP